jgi:hypothetical protein
MFYDPQVERELPEVPQLVRHWQTTEHPNGNREFRGRTHEERMCDLLTLLILEVRGLRADLAAGRERPVGDG